MYTVNSHKLKLLWLETYSKQQFWAVCHHRFVVILVDSFWILKVVQIIHL